MKPILSKSPILLVGDYPTRDDAADGVPFSGAAGKMLDGILRRSGITFPVGKTHVFLDKPRGDEYKFFFNKGYTLKEEFASAPTRLYSEIEACSPQIILALGSLALWALTGKTKMAASRGFLSYDRTNTYKVLATYSPRVFVNDHSLRPWVILDFKKALAAANPTPLSWPSRKVHIPQNIQDVRNIFSTISTLDTAVDIETIINLRQISTISFSPTPSSCYVIPIINKEKPGWSHWAPHEEKEIMLLMSLYLRGPTTKTFHNSLFDMSHLTYNLCPVGGRVDDTMLLAHALQPELQKSLAMVGATYANERSWKSMRVRPKDEEKSEE